MFKWIEEWLFSVEGAIASFEKAANKLETAVAYHLHYESEARSQAAEFTNIADDHKARAARAANISRRINELIA